MKAKTIMAAALIAFGAASASAQTMKVILKNGEIAKYKTSEVERVEFTEAIPVVDDGISANGHEYVDLGLPSGTLWAKCNIGAESPEEFGDYYAWGETETKEDYSSNTYKYYSTTKGTDEDGFDVILRGFTKYVPESNYGYNDFYDNKIILDEEDDVACVKWGGDWRIPTQDEFEELTSNCTWDWKERNGVKGFKVTGMNGSFIFLPAAGGRYGTSFGSTNDSGAYWCNSLYESYPNDAHHLYFYWCHIDPFYKDARRCGFPVRPVRRR